MKTLLTYPQNQGRFLIVLIPLILSFLLNCTSASNSSGPPPLPSDLMFTSSAIMGGSAMIGETGGSMTVLPCTVLDNVDIAALVNGNPSTDYNVVADLPVYYDRSLLAAADRTGDTITRTTEIQITDSTSRDLPTFSLTVNFSQCQTTHLTGTGDGTAGTPYELSKPEHLELMAHLVNNSNATHGAGHYDLTAPIDLEVAKAPWTEAAGGKGFTPIGTTVSAMDNLNHTVTFTGTFDCANNIISNLYINNPDENGQNHGRHEGLFGKIDSGGTVMNCGLTDVNVTGYTAVGALAGQNFGNVMNSYATGTVTGIDLFVGGLLGQNFATVMNSYATMTVSGSNRVGGLIGANFRTATVSGSYATGVVSGITIIGGLAGLSDGSITHAYATGNVIGTSEVGGLVGLMGDSLATPTLKYSYAAGDVTGNRSVGGLVGGITGATGITNAYSIGTVTGTGSAPSDVGGSLGDSRGSPITNSYWYRAAGVTLQSAGSAMNVSGITARTMAQLQVPAPEATGTDAVYVDWNKERDAAGIVTANDVMNWNFTTGNYPRLINVVCASRQHNPTDQGTCSATLP